MSNRSTIAALALLVLLASCACLGAFVSWTLNNATSRAEALENAGKDRLPAKFMLLAPQAPEHALDYVWTDILFMRTLNMTQARRRVEKHVCPFPLDIVSRLITRFTNPGELVFDPFSGLGTTPYQAIRLGRRGRGHDLNPDYWRASVRYCREAEVERLAPTLFDLADLEAPANGKNGHSAAGYREAFAAEIDLANLAYLPS